MAVLAIAIIFLCLGSVSAADDAIDANLTADDNSLEVSELNEESNIDEISTADSVDVVNEENDDVLGAYEEDKLDSTVYTTLTPVSGYTNVDGVITATVNVPIYVKMGGIMTIVILLQVVVIQFIFVQVNIHMMICCHQQPMVWPLAMLVLH